MPAVNTGGFQVSAIPRTDFVDPRLLTPNSQILSGIMDGAQGVNKLYQIAQDARMRPIQQQLAQIQLAQAQQEAAMPRIIPGDVVLQDQTRIFPAALDEEGVRTGPTETEYGDLVQISSGQRVGAGGVITPFETRKTVKTAADREAQAAKDAANLEAINALAAQRTTGKTYESRHSACLEVHCGPPRSVFLSLHIRHRLVPSWLLAWVRRRPSLDRADLRTSGAQ